MTERIKLNRRYTPQPVKISQERINAILKDISEGSTRFHASEANGIAYVTFYYWVKQGQLDLRYGADTINAQLVKALRKIEQDEIKECRNVTKYSADGHKGAQWTLERVYWKQFGGNAPVMELAEEMELEKGASKHDESNEEGSEESSEEISEEGREEGQGNAEESSR